MKELQATRLRRYREAAGFTQAQVAELLEVSQQAVGKWERENDPGDRWGELANLYGIGEQYPDAPFNPEKRAKWLEQRSAQFADRGKRLLDARG